MKRTLFASLALAITILVHPQSASAETLGMFFDEACTQCSSTVQTGQSVVMSVRVIRGGSTAEYPLRGLHFRITGLPAGWSATVTPTSAADVVVGDVFNEGIEMGFAEGLAGSCAEVLSCRIDALVPANNVQLSIERHSQGACFGNLCPCFSCIGPSGCVYCMSTTEATINGSTCVLSIQRSQWSQIKQLYQ